jgi:hypothetical protein
MAVVLLCNVRGLIRIAANQPGKPATSYPRNGFISRRRTVSKVLQLHHLGAPMRIVQQVFRGKILQVVQRLQVDPVIENADASRDRSQRRPIVPFFRIIRLCQRLLLRLRREPVHLFRNFFPPRVLPSCSKLPCEAKLSCRICVLLPASRFTLLNGGAGVT